MTDALLRRVFPRDVHHVRGLHEAVGRAVPERGRVLDLGCGANTELERYRTAGREVWGADFGTHADLRHPSWYRELDPSGRAPFPDAHFDAVAAVMVLEHVADPAGFFREVGRLLRPGGAFVGHTVSGWHYVTVIRRVFGLFPHAVSQAVVRHLYGRAEADTFPAYYRANTPGRLRRGCAAGGLGLVSVRRYADPGYFRFARPLEAAAILTDRVLDAIRPGCGRLYLTAVAEKLA